MKLICPQCQHSVEYSGDRPRFCSNCGQSLSTDSSDPGAAPTIAKPTSLELTGEFHAVDETLPPRETIGDYSAAVPQRVGNYRLLKRIGGGGMGSVYEAEDSGSGRRVALKLIKPEFALSPVAVERFRLEGRLASAIAHPRCVFVLAADEEARQPYIVMELMPGSTLADVIQERGPLPVTEAVSKILDVIEGLQEAHRLGVIHRDVKPSNCFVDVDGRLKIGDFGLAKMAANDGDLTRTGTFIGTPLFSSPEQIKRQPLTVQADVYSVCATLYYALTGQAPFAGGDAMSAVARIVSENPPPLRQRRPEVPRGLERVILKGLDRDPDNRWQDLDALRQALVRFLPGQVSRGSLVLRFAAYAIDVTILNIVEAGLVHGVITRGRFESPEEALGGMAQATAEALAVTAVLWFLYFGVLEGLTGWTLGKRLLRLRTCSCDGVDPPGAIRGLWRYLTFFNLIQLGKWIALILLFLYRPSSNDPRNLSSADALFFMLLSVAPNIAFFVGLGALLSTMRERNGYRGLHELASKTRVVELPPAPRTRVFAACQCDQPMTLRPDMPLQVGSYQIEGVVQWCQDEQTLVGHDPGLGRRVWVWVRPVDASPLDPKRRDLNRISRLRHVASGVEQNQRWDAFLAPSGTALPDLVQVQGRFRYSDTLAIIEQLTDELARSLDEGTVPERLSPRQVSVDSRGHVQLLGTALEDECAPAPAHDDEQRCLELLRQSAALMLEGQARSDAGPPHFRAPMPIFARHVFDLLLDKANPPTIAAFGKELKHLNDRPQEISRARRFVHAAAAAASSLGFFILLFIVLQLGPIFILATGMVFEEDNNAKLDEHSKIQLDVAAVQPSPFVRLAGVQIYQAEQQLLNERHQQSRRQQQWLSDRQKWSFVPTGPVVRLQQKNTRSNIGNFGQQRPRRIETYWHTSPRDHVRDLSPAPKVFWIVSAIAAALWIGWSFAIRGGISTRLLGLDLVRNDGRRAARWQYAVRALLFWAPQILMLAGALALDALYWYHWFESGWRDSYRWLVWLSWPMWWLGALMIPLGIGITVWKPERGWHDRIAGTWVVPR